MRKIIEVIHEIYDNWIIQLLGWCALIAHYIFEVI